MKKEQLTDIISEVSPTLCLAKFHDATIWLYNNRTAGCHHTPMVTLGTTPVTFYTPDEKRVQQKIMIEGGKPVGCSYCWNHEANNVESDRYKKSADYRTHCAPEDYLNPDFNFKPKTLELAFQNVCNLACSYCNSAYSNTWANDIKTHGNYEGLTSKHYQVSSQFDPSNMNLFWEWFETIVDSLETLRLTGGEPLLHEETFSMIEKMQKINSNIKFIIATNLCQKPLVIQRFVDFIGCIKGPRKVRINISNESAGPVAEFIRDGMVYKEWLENVRLLSETNTEVCISTTITAISLISMDQLYRDVIAQRVHTKVKPPIGINFCSFPEFQSIQCLTREEREFYHNKYTQFYKEIYDDLLPIEQGSIERVLTMLHPDLTHPQQAEYRKDSDLFFEQYCRRRNKAINFAELIGT